MRRFDSIRSIIVFAQQFPVNVSKVFNIFQRDYYLNSPNDFEPVNVLDYDLFALMAVMQKDEYHVYLKNLKSCEIISEWHIPRSLIYSLDPNVNPNDRPVHPMIVDRDLIFKINSTPIICRMDSEGRIIWHNSDFTNHHAMNIDHEGNIWFNAWAYNYSAEPGFTHHFLLNSNRSFAFDDEYIIRIDASNGKTLFSKSITEILIENDRFDLLEEAWRARPHPRPESWFYHSNDVEPVLNTGKYLQQGDLFISLRTLSCVVQYRPSTNEIVRVIDKGLSLQHDVNVINDSTISIVNNWAWPNSNRRVEKKGSVYNLDIVSDITIFDLSKDSSYSFAANLFYEHDIFTSTEGMSHMTDRGDIFFEEQNTGILWVLSPEEIKYKDIISLPIAGKHSLPNWTRIYEKNPLLD